MPTIKSIKVHNFRSIKDSEWVEFDQNLNVLVGPNESGKTNFLKALNSLNPYHIYDEDDLNSSERQNLIQKDPSEIPIISAKIKPSQQVCENLGIQEEPELVFKKYFDTSYELYIPAFDEEMSLKNEVGQDIRKIRNRLKGKLASVDSLFQVQNGISAINIGDVDPSNYYRARDRLMIRKNWNPPKDFTESLEDLQNALVQLNSQIETTTGGEVVEKAQEDIEEHLESTEYIFEEKEQPRYLQVLQNIQFVDDIEPISDHYNLVKPMTDNNAKTLANLMELADIEPKELQNLDRHGRRLEMEKSSEVLTKELATLWTQEDITFNLDIDGNYISLYLQDETESEDRPSDRSEGFRWFISFFLKFVSMQNKGENLEGGRNTLILDDLGGKLHPSGKRDLEKLIKELSEDKQIIYSTHAPSLIPQNRLEDILLLEKNKEGTEIKTEVQDIDNLDVLRPIRQSLGFELSETLFFNKKNIIVEGYSDKIILESVIRNLEINSDMNLSKTNIINAGGAPKMEFLAKIMTSEGFDPVILLDDDPEGRNQKEKLLNNPEVSSKNIILVNDPISSIDSDAEIEDLLGVKNYFTLVLDAKKSDLSKKEIKEINSKDIEDEWIAKSVKSIFDDYIDFNNKEIAIEFENRIKNGKTENYDLECIENNFSKLLEKTEKKMDN